jgi:HemY protein
MRAALWLLGLFALAVAVTLTARLDQGYVIVVFPPWRVELSFLLTLVLLAGGFVLASFLLRLARTALRLPEDLRAWRRHRHQLAADHALLDALRAHFDGDERKLQKYLKKARDCGAQDLLARLQPAKPETQSHQAGVAPPQGAD